MSAIEYNNLLFETSERLDELNVLKRLLFMCRGKLASGSEDNIQDALSLFKELEKRNNLGIDRLEEMKELLKGVREWPLFGNVRKFECKRKEYNELLERIIPALDELDDLERLIAMCRGKISEESEAHIEDVRSLLKQLENQNNLGTHRLVILKEILVELEKNDLLKEVEEFEERRNQEDESERKKGQRGAFVSSVGNKFIGAVKLVCNFCTTRGLLVVNSAMALGRCSSVKEYMEVFKDVVLVSYNKLVGIRDGSLCFIVQAETPSALRELWDIYQSGALKNRLQEFLVSDEIKQLASGEDVEVTVSIDEKEYKEAYFDLMLLENQAFETKEDGRPGRRTRSNSDSFLCFKPNEVDSTLMRLKHAENKWNFERQILEEEIEKLKAKIAETGNLKRRLFWHEEESAQKTEDIERPRKRRRRNSDSNLYCKARDEEVKESKKETEISLEEKTKYLDSEREAFVQNYLQGIIHETHSMTTETSDSGIRTHGAPSDLDEMENVADYSQTYCLKDLGSDVIRKLQRALDFDDAARGLLNQSFGIRGNFLRREDISLRQSFWSRDKVRRNEDIFTLFPDTPVKLLKDVLETLQLYDLVDLLREKPQLVRSLRLALPLQEIEKLRKTADPRPTTYHSNVAVLIIADKEDSNIKGLENFFKGLNSNSDVKIIKCKNALRTKDDIDWMKLKFAVRNTIGYVSDDGRLTIRYDSDDDDDQEIQQQQEFQEETEKKEKELQTQIENIEASASAVIDSWIHNQGNFSLFAVFQFSTFSEPKFGLLLSRTLLESITEKLVSGIPDKVKLIIGPRPMGGPETPPETLKLVARSFRFETFPLQLLEILNKRWQTLDLISMMKELRRTLVVMHSVSVYQTIDGLSSLPRFKKE